MNIQSILESPQERRLEVLVREICGDDLADRPTTILEFQMAMRKLQQYRIIVEPAKEPDGEKSFDEAKNAENVNAAKGTPSDNTVVINIARSGLAEKLDARRKNSYYSRTYANDTAYDFLSDYLGLGLPDPLSLEQMARKYPLLSASADGSTLSEDQLKDRFYQIIASIFKIIHRYMELRPHLF